MTPPQDGSDERRLAGAVRDACLREIERGREEAAIQGLCSEGAMEYALDRLRHLEPGALLARPDAPDDEPGS